MKPTDINSPVGFASVPTSTTRRWRTFLPYQLLRFAIINVKMIRMLMKAHAEPPARH
jgi:hypothetical protein